MRYLLWGAFGAVSGYYGVAFYVRHRVIKTHGRAIWVQYSGWKF